VGECFRGWVVGGAVSATHQEHLYVYPPIRIFIARRPSA